MLVFLLLLLLLNIFCFLWYLSEKKKYADIEKLPGPPTQFLLGNYRDLGTNSFDTFQNVQHLIKKYGKIVRVWQGPFRMNLHVTDPDLVEYFLSSNVHIKKSAGYKLFGKWLGDGLITSTGELWKKYRKILTPAFHFNILNQFTSGFQRNSDILVKILREQSGETTDVCRFMKNYAMDSLCETTMAVNFGCQENGDNIYLSCMDTVMDVFIRRFFSVLKRSDLFFSLTAEGRKNKHLISTMQDITISVIQKRRRELEDGSVNDDEDSFGIRKRKVFIDTLLSHPGLSDQDIEWQVNTFFFAGHDTVSSALSFSAYEIAKHQDVQETILAEIVEVIGADRYKEITLSSLQMLNYLDRVVKECMRLYPPVGQFERELTEDVFIKGDLKIPKGATVSFHPYSHHRNSEIYNDPEEFDPDRFTLENTLSRHPFAYIPFSAGPRNCIGQKYALIAVKVALANIIRNFKLYPADFPHVPTLGSDSILKSLNGLPIKLIYR